MTRAIKIGTSNHGNNQMSALEKLANNVQQINIEVVKINTRFDAELPHLATKAELNEVKGQLSTEIVHVKNELTTEIAHVKNELTAEIAQVKNELTTEIAQVKNELTTEIAQVKNELTTEIAQVKNELSTELAVAKGELRTEIAKSHNSIIVWLIGIAIATGLINLYGPTLPHLHSSGSTALLQTK